MRQPAAKVSFPINKTKAARLGRFGQDIHHHSTQVLSFSVTLDPNESMPAPSRRNVFFSGTMLTLVYRFMYIYTWASIHTTSIFKTSTEVLSIVLHTCRNTQSCLVPGMSFEGQDTPSPLLVGWRTAKSTTSGTSLLQRHQVENRFPSVKIFITIHQPKSFFSP